MLGLTSCDTPSAATPVAVATSATVPNARAYGEGAAANVLAEDAIHPAVNDVAEAKLEDVDRIEFTSDWSNFVNGPVMLYDPPPPVSA